MMIQTARLRRLYIVLLVAMCMFVCVFVLKPLSSIQVISASVWHPRRFPPECIDCIQVNKSITIKEFGDFVFPEPNCHSKLLVYECLDTDVCGGLADRQKGIMSAFLLALLTNRTFVLHHKKSCNLEKIMPPRVYNWFKCLPYLGLYSFKDQIVMRFIDRKGNLPANYSMFPSGDIWPEHIVKVHTNTRINMAIKDHPDARTMLPWLFNASDKDVVTGLMKVLFQPEESLRNHLRTFINLHTSNGKKTLVAAHIRTLFLNDEENDIKLFLDFLAQYSNASKYVIYVATDNIMVREAARRKFANFVTSDTDIVHIDEEQKACTGMYGAVFEQHILASADILVLSNSGFSRLAAYIRDRSDNIFRFTGRTASSEIPFEKVTLEDLVRLFPNS